MSSKKAAQGNLRKAPKYPDIIEPYRNDIARDSATFSAKLQFYDADDVEQEILIRLWNRSSDIQQPSPSVGRDKVVRNNIRQCCLNLYRDKPKRCGQINPVVHIPDHSPMVVETNRSLQRKFPKAHIDWSEYCDEDFEERMMVVDLIGKLLPRLTPIGRAIVTNRLCPSDRLLKIARDAMLETKPMPGKRKTITIPNRMMCEYLGISLAKYAAELKRIAKVIKELTT